MRKVVSLLLPFFALPLACAAAQGQPAAQRQTDASCRAMSARYLGPSPDKKHLTEQEEYAYEYEQNKKYLRRCGNSDDNVTRAVKESVAGYEATQTVARLVRALRKEGALEAKDPKTYAALASAYDVRYQLLARAYLREDTFNPGVIAARNAGLDEAADLTIDSYARAVAACGEAKRCRARKAVWTQRLTELYKTRHGGSDAGLSETTEGVLNRPLPQPPLPWWLTDTR